jgi:hypothetical protein
VTGRKDSKVEVLPKVKVSYGFSTSVDGDEVALDLIAYLAR